MSEQMQVALVRAFLNAAGAGILAGLGVLSAGGDWRTAGFAAVGAAVSVVMGRGVGEGLMDGQRASRGELIERSALPESVKGSA